jgi:hypothetical protein
MHMTSSMNVWSPLVNSRVNHKAGCIYRLICAIHPFPLLINTNHVRDFKQGEVHSVRIDPEGMWLDRVCASSTTRTNFELVLINYTSQANMATASIGKAQFGKYAECSCHLAQKPSSFGFLGGRAWNVV